jgi:hypothetical protein
MGGKMIKNMRIWRISTPEATVQIKRNQSGIEIIIASKDGMERQKIENSDITSLINLMLLESKFDALPIKLKIMAVNLAELVEKEMK